MWNEKDFKIDVNSLERFIAAQENTYERALEEVKNGRKRSHWMWYIFPQLRGLGESEMAYIYGISGADEAKAYLADPILSKRLVEICEALLKHTDKSAYGIFGDIDEMKLKSSMTLFALVSEDESVFQRVLDAFFAGERDVVTVSILKSREEKR